MVVVNGYFEVLFDRELGSEEELKPVSSSDEVRGLQRQVLLNAHSTSAETEDRVGCWRLGRFEVGNGEGISALLGNEGSGRGERGSYGGHEEGEESETEVHRLNVFEWVC